MKPNWGIPWNFFQNKKQQKRQQSNKKKDKTSENEIFCLKKKTDGFM